MPRIALVGVAVCALAACGGTEPTDTGPGDPVGVWNATIESHDLPPFTTTAKSCIVHWVLTIEPDGSGEPGHLYSVIPLTATMNCDNRGAVPWQYRGGPFNVRATGDSVVFDFGQGDSLIVAGFTSNSHLSGRVSSLLFPGGTFTAERRSGPDPNLAPYSIETFAGPYKVDVGDSVALDVDIRDAYDHTLAPSDVTFGSSNQDVATVTGRGVVHGVAPGRARVELSLGELADTAEFEVLTPAASVEITDVPDSLIDPTVYGLGGVARDANGTVLERSFHWTSSNPAVATVDEFGPTGVVRTQGPGTVTITARSTTHTDSAVLTVLPGVASIEITGADNGTLPIAVPTQLSATTRDAQGNVLSGRPVSWLPVFSGTISVTETGVATAHQGGPGQVTVQAEQVQQVEDLTGVMDGPLVSITAGYGHVCGLTGAGTTYCWGHASEGRLGVGGVDGAPGPIPIATPHPFASIYANTMHTCGLDQAGAAYCWGSNGAGELGQAGGQLGEVLAVSGGLAFTQLAIGGDFTCGLTAAQAAYCWGGNAYGQLGRGAADGASHPAPEAVTGGHLFVEIHAVESYACGLTTAGEAWCWGGNFAGTLGLETSDLLPHPDPVRSASSYTFSKVTTGGTLACGITAAGPVVCWGVDRLTPSALDATTGYVALASGYQHYCRIDTAGHLSCWGVLDEFNLSYIPPEPVSAVTAGVHLTCVMPVGKKVRCWGINDGGQIGSPDGSALGPVEVAGQP